MACARTELQIRPEEPPRCLLEARHLPALHREGLHDAIAGDGLVQDVLDLGQLVLPMPRGVPHASSHPPRRTDDHRHEEEQHPCQLAAHDDDEPRGEDEGKELLQKLREHRRHRVLHALDVIDDGGEDRAGGVPLEELHGAAQDGLIEVVPHVRDHAEAGVVHQIGAGVVADALEHGGSNEREGDDAPGIVEMRGDKLLQTEVEAAAEEVQIALRRLRD